MVTRKKKKKKTGRMRAPSAAIVAADEDQEALHIVIMDAFDQNAPFDGRKSLSQGDAKYARVFASYAGARVTEALRLREDGDEPATEFGKIIRTHERIKKYTNFNEGELPDQAKLLEFGASLFKTLIAGRVHDLYIEACARQRDGVLDLVFTSMVPWIAEKPWEFAYDPERRRFLATEDVNFIRNVLTSVPSDRIKQPEGRLRILVAAAQPVSLVPLSTQQEVDVIRRGFEQLEREGLVKVDIIARTSPEDLHKALSTGKYSIVHFVGHGDFDEQTGEGSLIFEDGDRGEQPLRGEQLRQLFCNRGLSLVFLNACLSGTGGRADFNKGVAQQLVEQGLPALVANQYSVLDSSATTFAKHFYWSLAHGLPLGRAAREARIAVNYSLDGDIIDWAVPVVYARDSNMVFASALDRRDAIASPRATDVVRRAARKHKYTIAVWDTDRSLPGLEETLARMTAAQNVFAFEVVDTSLPLDVWDKETKTPDGTTYLWAEKLARRIHSKAARMRVDVLTCITRHWMRDDEILNRYGWWGDSRKPALVIFSYAGFDLPAAGAVTNRVLANMAVSVLAGHFGALEPHVDGEHDCPLFHNPKRDFGVLKHAQRFDAGCRLKLREQLGADYAALEKLLKVFL
jgi:CHAT domain-containing protein